MQAIKNKTAAFFFSASTKLPVVQFKPVLYQASRATMSTGLKKSPIMNAEFKQEEQQNTK